MAEDFLCHPPPVSPQSVMLKMILLGDGGAGKSSLMTRYVNDEFDPSCAHTVGVEFLKKDFKDGKVTYVVQIWDTAGQERFRSLRTPFYRGSDVCMLVYSVDDRKSFDNLKMWMAEFRKHTDVQDLREFPFVVVGNKADVSPEQSRVVTKTEAESWCCKNGPYPYLETSAKASVNVQEAFQMAVRSWKNLNSSRAEKKVSMPTGVSERKNSKFKDSLSRETSNEVLTHESTTIKLGKKQKSSDLSVGGRPSGGCC